MPVKYNHKTFLEKLEEKYPKKFEVISKYETSHKKIKIKHLECGEIFEIQPYKLLQRGSTPCCSNKSINKNNFKTKIEELYKNTIEVLGIYTNRYGKIDIKCNLCNKITNVAISSLIYKKVKCSCLKKKSKEEYKKEFEEKQKNFELLSDYISHKDNVLIRCVKCKDKFLAKASRALSKKQGCLNCVGLKKKTTEQFKKEVYEWGFGEYEVMSEYINADTKVIIKHSCGNQYEVMPNSFKRGDRCPKCAISQGTSKSEKELLEFIKDNYKGKIISSDRTVLKPKELDVYLPELKLAFEFDGLYWHNEEKVGKNYHIYKTIECENKNIQLIHVFEDEWINKKEIVKSRILNLLGENKNRIYARKCKVKSITNKERKIFLEENHIQGDVGASIQYGLIFNEQIVGCISFSKLRNSMSSKEETATHELLRFATLKNTTIIGGFSKLLKNVLKIENIKEVKTFADRRWSTGNVYSSNNFIFSHDSKPNYFYFKKNDKNKNSRIQFQKHKLKDKLENFNIQKTEIENMRDNGYYRIFDCGNKVYYYKNS